jgi:riboflavin biosynthesis pyrimidine reductase/predicted DsbA family dithiol-disulfide isomerase
MPLVIPLAHDFVCPWCWIALSQARRLAAEFDVTFDWLGYELYPGDTAWPEPATAESGPGEDRPKTPSRLALAHAAEGMPPPREPRPERVRTFHAHEAVEYAKLDGKQDLMVERLYRAYWERGEQINELKVLTRLASGLIDDLDEFEHSVRSRRFRDRITLFDEPARAKGVYSLPTYWIGGERYAAQPTTILREALRAHAKPAGLGDLYLSLTFGSAPAERPYVVINMASTIDGKTATGERHEHAMDLGSDADHEAMRRIQSNVQAVLLGAGSLRATPGLWYPKRLWRFVATRSGDLPRDGRFFTDVPDRAVVISPGCANVPGALTFGGQEIDWPAALRHLRRELGIESLLVEGGGELNASLLAQDLADELFLTVAPKVRLGRHVPTYADGDPLPRKAVLRFELVSERRVGDEMFLRYRRAR